ncbi:UDP-N-acetylmuramoyl-L-alanyl-D-glutamate--2,6-diaminopimelate ligase [bacterium]|nr:UDP-N-acetylmuramoyl-L-alanyl-D-glutamate--2,6-diaminopimelate ligase [bacterium]
MKTADFIKLLERFEPRFTALDDAEILKITADSREASEGYAFFCVRGLKSDAHDFIDSAFANGASLVVGEKPLDLKNYVRISSVRDALNEILPGFYGCPDRKGIAIGVTGTNGKTSTTFILEHILEKSMSCGVIGTLHYKYADKLIPAENTTPVNWRWYSLLDDMRRCGTEAVISEVSSHALAENRIGATLFDAAVFTNLTRDHMDFHKTVENYYEAKKRLFTDHLVEGGTAVVNIDDEFGRRLSRELPAGVKQIRVSTEDRSAELFVGILELTAAGSRIRLDMADFSREITIPLAGRFNIYNAAGSFAAAQIFVGKDAAAERLAEGVSVPGRLERIGRSSVFVDYAHTPDALENVLNTLNGLGVYSKIITVVGAGGDRDKGKRPLMGAISCKLSDVVILTDDNPRTEDPDTIVSEIFSGCDTSVCRVEIIRDRASAIRRAIELSDEKTAVLIAGKGAEDYQITKSGKHHFSDREEVEKVLKEREV